MFEGFTWSLIKLLDIVLILTTVKSMKLSLQTDIKIMQDAYTIISKEGLVKDVKIPIKVGALHSKQPYKSTSKIH